MPGESFLLSLTGKVADVARRVSLLLPHHTSSPGELVVVGQLGFQAATLGSWGVWKPRLAFFYFPGKEYPLGAVTPSQ